MPRVMMTIYVRLSSLCIAPKRFDTFTRHCLFHCLIKNQNRSSSFDSQLKVTALTRTVATVHGLNARQMIFGLDENCTCRWQLDG